MNDDLDARVFYLEAVVKMQRDQLRFQDKQLKVLETGFRSLLVRVHAHTNIEEDVAWDCETLH